MIDEVSVEPAKYVVTKDHRGKENGFLIEMFKDADRTVVYLSAASPGAFKGYPPHRVRPRRYVCLKGRMRIILYRRAGGIWEREEHILDASEPTRLFIPKNVATGLENISDEDGWLVNYPDPPYDPAVKDEQIEYTQEELE